MIHSNSVGVFFHYVKRYFFASLSGRPKSRSCTSIRDEGEDDEAAGCFLTHNRGHEVRDTRELSVAQGRGCKPETLSSRKKRAAQLWLSSQLLESQAAPAAAAPPAQGGLPQAPGQAPPAGQELPLAERRHVWRDKGFGGSWEHSRSSYPYLTPIHIPSYRQGWVGKECLRDLLNELHQFSFASFREVIHKKGRI